MAQRKNNPPVILGPGGQPLPASAPLQAREEPPQPPEPPPADEQPAAEAPQADEATSALDETPTETAAPPQAIYQVKVALDVDPRQVPAALVVLLPFDPNAAYRTRVEASRDQFFKTRDTMVAAAEASLRSRGVNVKDPRRAAAGMIERQFMAQIWDAAFGAVSGAQVGLVYAAALSGGEQAIGTMLVSPFDGARMWVTSRANMLGDRFGAWAMPVSRGDQMPAIAVLNGAALEPLRMNFARVRV